MQRIFLQEGSRKHKAECNLGAARGDRGGHSRFFELAQKNIPCGYVSIPM